MAQRMCLRTEEVFLGPKLSDTMPEDCVFGIQFLYSVLSSSRESSWKCTHTSTLKHSHHMRAHSSQYRTHHQKMLKNSLTRLSKLLACLTPSSTSSCCRRWASSAQWLQLNSFHVRNFSTSRLTLALLADDDTGNFSVWQCWCVWLHKVHLTCMPNKM